MGSGHLSDFDASMYYSGSDTSFAVLPFPRIDFGNDAYLEIDQDLDLSCVSCFSKLAEDAVRNEEISVLITGKPTLKVQALPTAHLDIHKTVTLPGRFFHTLFPAFRHTVHQ